MIGAMDHVGMIMRQFGCRMIHFRMICWLLGFRLSMPLMIIMLGKGGSATACKSERYVER